MIVREMIAKGELKIVRNSWRSGKNKEFLEKLCRSASSEYVLRRVPQNRSRGQKHKKQSTASETARMLEERLRAMGVDPSTIWQTPTNPAHKADKDSKCAGSAHV
ncbi:MAG: hypothetical protein N3F67_01950 [Acidilobaceae archaeon]|nr:hypothetical protein [Acidilobaceae archaeon]